MGRKRKRDDFSSSSSDSSSEESDDSKPVTKKANTDQEGKDVSKGAGNDGEKTGKLQNFNGYYAIPIQILRSDRKKYLYVKEHISKNPDDLGAGRTLFVTNLAPDCTKEDLETIFSVFGPIESITLDSFVKTEAKKHSQPKKKTLAGEPDERQKLILEERLKMQEEVKKAFEAETKEPFSRAGYAHIVFTNPDAIKKGFKRLGPSNFEGKVERGQKRGIAKWLSEYNSEANLDPTKLQNEVNQYMFEFDRKQALHKKKIDELSNMPDADGWVTVTKKGKKKTEGAEGKKMGVATLGPFELQRLQQKAQEKQLTDFYRFQHAENRKNYIDSLRERFEEDKRRIERMKQQRKFRPDY